MRLFTGIGRAGGKAARRAVASLAVTRILAFGLLGLGELAWLGVGESLSLEFWWARDGL
jgi:hypothetical protein